MARASTDVLGHVGELAALGADPLQGGQAQPRYSQQIRRLVSAGARGDRRDMDREAVWKLLEENPEVSREMKGYLNKI